jgi:hydrogenase expression/formation protein HypE
MSEPTRQTVVIGDIRDERIVLGHGAGGRKMHRLINQVFLKHFGSPALRRMEDSARLALASKRICMTTDSYVVQPLFFPGGDIGRLAVCGTVNDLAVMGARARYLSVGFILREGLEVSVLERVSASLARAARAAGAEVVTGDTKVLERGGDEGLYINVTGIGERTAGSRLGAGQVRAGDAVILTGGIGEHEAAVGLARGSYRFRARVVSDCAPLGRMLLPVLGSQDVRLARDPTRGGLATTLCEFADATGLGFVLDEEEIPVAREVRGVASLLGLDPLYMANEGKAVLVCSRSAAARVVRQLRRHRYGRKAAVIGAVTAERKGVWLETKLGSLRPLVMLEGEQLPRIC